MGLRGLASACVQARTHARRARTPARTRAHMAVSHTPPSVLLPRPVAAAVLACVGPCLPRPPPTCPKHPSAQKRMENGVQGLPEGHRDWVQHARAQVGCWVGMWGGRRGHRGRRGEATGATPRRDARCGPHPGIGNCPPPLPLAHARAGLLLGLRCVRIRAPHAGAPARVHDHRAAGGA